MDVAGPHVRRAGRIMVSVNSNKRVRSYEDGAQLYTCRVHTPIRLGSFSAGDCQRTTDGDFSLNLFHHTTSYAKIRIRSSNELWGSSWNLQGTRKLQNVAYTYFTSLPRIRNQQDLNRIAMASTGKIVGNSTLD
jgi:hypothetical protein